VRVLEVGVSSLQFLVRSLKASMSSLEVCRDTREKCLESGGDQEVAGLSACGLCRGTFGPRGSDGHDAGFICWDLCITAKIGIWANRTKAD